MWPESPCTARVTQEDLRCDDCRESGTAVCLLALIDKDDGSRISRHIGYARGSFSFTAPETGTYTFR